LSILTMLFACEDQNPVVMSNFDHEAQVAIDFDSLKQYLQTHYYNPNDGAIWTVGSVGEGALPAGEEITLFEDPKLETMSDIEANDTETNYTMYFYNIEEGNDGSNSILKKTPSVLDAVSVRYVGMLLDSTVFDESGTYPVTLNLGSTVLGFSYGMTKLKGGTLQTNPDLTYEYTNVGKGYIFLPSGLGYKENVQRSIPSNSPIVFKLELHDVHFSDLDNDGIPSSYESFTNSNGTLAVIDTDGDGYEDYLDLDDDGNGVLTKVQADLNEDGEISNTELEAYLTALYPAQY
jgi:FKBP-type peptidyl-prolyl cis-trans isomerase FkpA